MPQIKLLIAEKDAYIDLLKKKHAEPLIPVFEEGLAQFEAWRRCTTEVQEIREQINANSAEFKKTKDQALIDKTRELKQKLQAKLDEERLIQEKLAKTEMRLPNWLNDDVPLGGEGDERVVSYQGTPRVGADHEETFKQENPDTAYQVFQGKPFHHYDMVGSLIDQEIAGEVAQTKFFYELDELVLLDLALSMYAVEFFRGRDWNGKTMIPPYMLRQSVEEQICYFEAFEDTIFRVNDEGLVLLPSSEHAIVAYYRDTIFDQEQLPLRILAWSPSFRREAGAHGKDTRGIFRVKQFHKAELHSIVKEGEDEAELQKMTDDTVAFMESLGLPTRTIVVAGGDMDKRALKQVDVETWMPGQGKYRETHSIATLGTWVSEKSKIRYRAVDPDGKKKKNVPAVNLYATGVAVQRTLCAIAENHYNPETQTITVPQPLLKYMMGVEEIPVKK
jgi:seryl-tRNA synthetase